MLGHPVKKLLLRAARYIHRAGISVIPFRLKAELVRAEFDPEYYAQTYPEVAQSAPDLFLHFLHTGWRQGKNPNNWFSTAAYLALNDDVRAAGINPFMHYVLYGRKNRRRTELQEIYPTIKSEFDAEYYFSVTPELRPGEDPVGHYITVGWREGRNPNPRFFTQHYLESNPDVRKAAINPFYHYLKHGRAEGRPSSPFGSGPRTIIFPDLLNGRPEVPPDPGQATIVVPIYNNFDDVATLLPSLQSTVDKRIKVVLVNDCSPDQRILPLLTSWSANNPNWTLIDNECNLGFAAAVNRGIMSAEGHVIVLNSDVELPPGWVERILAPIVLHPDEIGSVTPFSNHSTLTGFPKLGSEKPLSSLGDLESVDRAFQTLNPIYPDIPSGVGFCLAMSRKVIDEIGVLDADAYKRGYYEDTDWCQRLVAAGYRNVVCGNLFVHHKVGSKSFSVRARRALSKANRAVFDARYPYYELARQRFYEADPLLEIRTLAQAMLWRRAAKSSHLIVDHAWGGGANDFAERLRKSLLGKEAFVIELVLREDGVDIKFHYGEHSLEVRPSYRRDLWNIADHFTVDQIILNGLQGASEVHDTLADICELALRRSVIIYIHDFFSICPSMFLLKDDDRHCGIPDRNTCNACFHQNRNIRHQAFSIDEWRRDWRKVLSRAKEINLFSQSSKDLFSRAYPDLKGPEIRIVDPGYIADLPAVQTPRPDGKIQIGVLGRMWPHKGSGVIIALADYLNNNEGSANAAITVIGSWEILSPPKNVKLVGTYEVSNLSNIVARENIHAVVFPSVFPETYSYTLSEIFAMQLPVVSLRLGAQGERVSRYEYGVTVEEPDPALIFAALKDACRKRWPGWGEMN